MQSLLKYLLPVIAVIVFWNCSEVSMSASLEVDNIEVATIESTAQSDVYEAETDPSLSLRSTQRMQGASRRPSDLQRYGHKFIKVAHHSRKTHHLDVNWHDNTTTLAIYG